MGLEKRQSLSILPCQESGHRKNQTDAQSLPLSQAKTVGEEGTEAREGQSVAQGVSWGEGWGTNLGLRLKAGQTYSLWNSRTPLVRC